MERASVGSAFLTARNYFLAIFVIRLIPIMSSKWQIVSSVDGVLENKNITLTLVVVRVEKI